MSRRLIDALSLALEDSDAFVRQHAVWSAGQRGDKSLGERLLIALCDPVADVRAAALRGLGELALPQALTRGRDLRSYLTSSTRRDSPGARARRASHVSRVQSSASARAT